MSDDWQKEIDELESRRERARGHGGPEWVESEHKKGRLTARERIELLLDPGTFQEIGMLATMKVRGPDGEVKETLPAGFVCGFGRVDGRPVAVGSEDYTVALGTWTGMYLGKPKGEWPGYIESLAMEWEIPLVMFQHGVGGDVVSGHGDDPEPMPPGLSIAPVLDLLDRVPSVTAVMGSAGGGSAARAICSHFSVMSRPHGAAFAGGPALVERSIGQKVDKFELGGHEVHLRESGAFDNGADSEEEIIDQIKRFLSYLPKNVHELPSRFDPTEDDPPDRLCEKVLKIVPNHPRRVYNPRALIKEICDKKSFFEIGAEWAKPLVVGLARIGGIPIGVLANDGRHSGGAMTAQACDKQARFVDMCNTFHIPIVYLADVPGLMIGPAAERAGTLRAGGRALLALHRATVPVVTVQVRRAFGIGSQATGSPDRLSIKLAWPTMTVGLGGMPVEGGALAASRQEIESAEDPHAKLREVEERLHKQVATAWSTAEYFDAEDLIDPRETRRVVYRWLDIAFDTQRPGPKPGPGNRP